MDKFNIMDSRCIIFLGAVFIAASAGMNAQEPDSVLTLTGIVYDELFQPVPVSHVINLRTDRGDVTDSLGIFSLPVKPSDTLLFTNIAFHDSLVPVSQILNMKHIRLRRKVYPLPEARIFEWGSSYDDFKQAVIQMPDQPSLGKSLGLPRQDPDYVPREMNEKAIKSPLFLITSPASFFYYNFSRKARSARKVYWLRRNLEEQEEFDRILDPDNIAGITGSSGEQLQDFLLFLNENLACDFHCTELEIYTEIHNLWSMFMQTGPVVGSELN